MKSIFFFFFVCLPTIGISQSKDLTNTVWHVIPKGIDIEPSYLEFQENGQFTDSRLTYELKGDGEYTWTQKGNKVILSYNNGYSIHKGKIKGDLIRGKSKNKSGTKWTWTASLTSDLIPK